MTDFIIEDVVHKDAMAPAPAPVQSSDNVIIIDVTAGRTYTASGTIRPKATNQNAADGTILELTVGG